jgi:hypothetical protein
VSRRASASARNATRGRAIGIAGACLASLACAFPPEATAAIDLSAGILAGALQPDARAADHQWDVAPRAAWGAQALAGAGRWAGGARVWIADHEHELGLPDAPTARVRASRWEAVGRRELLAFGGWRASATASAGLLRLAWRPDEVAAQSGGSGPAVVVALRPVHEWTGAAGVAVQRRLAARWALGAELEHGVYALDVARREGDDVVVRRERFGEWSARVELAWRHGVRDAEDRR